jgi:glycosyltransferase involved in cell wall biosynthesis
MKLSSVSFFCPAYHDEKNLPRLIPAVVAFLEGVTDTYEILVIHDGGPDRTGAVADELAAAHPRVRVIHHARNLGYGATLKEGFRTARHDYVMYTDGDAQFDVREFGPVLPLLDSHDVLSGYALTKAASFGRKVQSFAYNALLFVLFGSRWRDANCSMKVYKRRVLDRIDIRSTSAFIDAEMLLNARRAGFSIAQFQVTHYPRLEGVAHGSKPLVIAGTIWDMLKFRLGLL